MEHDILQTADGRRIAYCRTPGAAPGLVFLGGFRSDMSGTKASHLEDWARSRGRAFLRLDYTGHGVSSGAFEDGCIGDWARDASDAVDALTEGPQILVGSSMGGWIALLLARWMPERIAGLVGIAAAPDFTEDSMWASFDEEQRRALAEKGRVEVPSEYSADPYPITARLIEDGRAHLVMRSELVLPFPVRLLQGMADVDVPFGVALRLAEHAISDDLRLTLVKGADHRFSAPAELALIVAALDELTGAD